ncbi:hypothetical protein SprV_0200758200 [Sparganum proliferum]
MDDTRLPQQLFFGDVAAGTRRPGGQKRRYTDTLKDSLEQLQINRGPGRILAQNRPAWRREMKTVAAIYEGNQIAAAKAKRVARKSQVPRLLDANYQLLPSCPCFQHASRARIGIVGHLLTQCANNPTSTSSPLTPAPTPASTTTTIISRTPPTDGATSGITLSFTIITNTPTPAMGTRLITVLIAIAHSPHISAWSVTCEAIVQRLAN